MASIGITNKPFVSAIAMLDRRDIFRSVSDIFNEEYYTGVAELMQEAGRYEKTTMHEFHNFVNEPLYVLGDTTGATIVGSGSSRTLTGVKLTAATSGRARLGMMALLPNSQVAIITAISVVSSEQVLTLKGVSGSNLTLVAGAKIGIFGLTVGAQSTGVSNVRFGYTKYSQKLHTFREVNEIDDIQAQAQVDILFKGQPYIVYKDLIEKAVLYKSGINATLFASQLSDSAYSDASPNLTDPNGSNAGAVQTSRGVNEYVTTYGIADTVASLDSWTLADQEDLINQMLVNRCPKKFMALGGTKPLIKVSNHLKSLGSSATISSGQLSLDGKQLDFGVEKLSYGGFEFEFANLPILDHQALFSQTDMSKSIYYIPKDKVKLQDGGYAPRMRMRYQPHQIKNGLSGSDVIGEWNTGANAPDGPTDGEQVWKHHMISYQSVEILGAQHFARQKVVS